MPNVQNLTMYAGEDRTFTLYARDWTNSPLSVSGVSIEWRVGQPPSANNETYPSFTKTGTAVSTNQFTVSVSAADTKYLSGDYGHQAWATISGQTYCVTEGRLRIQPWIGS